MSETADLIAQAEELALAGKLDEALRAYDAAVAADCTDPLAWVGKASVLKAKGMYTESAECFIAARAGILDHNANAEETGAFLSMLHVLQAEALLYAEKPDKALLVLDEADRIRPPDAASLVVRGQAFAQKKAYEDAGNCFYRAEEWCNANEDSMLTQVWFCKVNLAKETGGILAPPYAAEMYEKRRGFRQPKGSFEELLERANNLRTAGLMYDALRYYDAAVEADLSQAASTLFMKGVVFEQLRRSADALDCYSEALKNNPEPGDEFRIRTRWAALRAAREN
ncbi:tetratricopeptide repeat protein [Methanorbis rubei]|uniref:tetratricopeptide repeat protein n=1 Tax=Methanorbis rubei TaxID=3028300 RepID=UPI0030B897C8